MEITFPLLNWLSLKGHLLLPPATREDHLFPFRFWVSTLICVRSPFTLLSVSSLQESLLFPSKRERSLLAQRTAIRFALGFARHPRLTLRS
jgi:hypothetical protein